MDISLSNASGVPFHRQIVERIAADVRCVIVLRREEAS